VNLWVPFEVADLDEALRFYVHLGLSPVDTWDRDGERGAVLRVPGGGFVELVQPAPGSAEPAVALALELADSAAVRAAQVALGGPPPGRFPRGHFGFVVRDPAGHPVLVWSER